MDIYDTVNCYVCDSVKRLFRELFSVDQGQSRGDGAKSNDF